jgi:hypothetical protein
VNIWYGIKDLSSVAQFHDLVGRFLEARTADDNPGAALSPARLLPSEQGNLPERYEQV